MATRRETCAGWGVSLQALLAAVPFVLNAPLAVLAFGKTPTHGTQRANAGVDVAAQLGFRGAETMTITCSQQDCSKEAAVAGDGRIVGKEMTVWSARIVLADEVHYGREFGIAYSERLFMKSDELLVCSLTVCCGMYRCLQSEDALFQDLADDIIYPTV